jgi:hypothetical protein
MAAGGWRPATGDRRPATGGDSEIIAAIGLIG